MNPYFGRDFFSFFALWFERMGALCTGKLPMDALASDEVQIFVLLCVSVASALTGTLLVLKKMTMLANALSHTLLLGIVVTYLLLLPFDGAFQGYQLSLNVLFLASLITALLTTGLTRLLTQYLRVQEDASIGLVFNTLFALGVVLVTVFTRNAHLGIEAIMGNVDALHVHDILLVWPVAAVNGLVLVLLYKEFKVMLFDSSFGDTQGFSSQWLSYLLMFLTAATVVSAFRAVGVLLVLAFLVGPALTARLLVRQLKHMLLVACVVGGLSSVVSVALARHLLSVYQFPVSTTGLVVSVLGVVYFGVAALTAALSRGHREGVRE